MSTITNITHFLNDEGELADLNPDAGEFAALLTAIIEQTSSRNSDHYTTIDTPCQSIVNGEVCLGALETAITDEDHINWERIQCGENGLITEWQDTQWNQRKVSLH